MQASTDISIRNADLSARDVATELGVAYDTVRRLLQAELLRGYKADRRGQWRVTRAALNEFKAAGGVKPQGRPRKDEGLR